MTIKHILIISCFLLSPVQEILAYPIDGYLLTGIRRLMRLEKIQKGEIKDTPLIKVWKRFRKLIRNCKKP